HIVRGDAGADRDVQYVAEEPERPLTDLERSHEGRSVEVAQQLKGSHARIDLGQSLQWRLRRGVDTREPEVGRDEELHSIRTGRILRAGAMQPARNSSNACENRENQCSSLLHPPLHLLEDRLRSGPHQIPTYWLSDWRCRTPPGGGAAPRRG